MSPATPKLPPKKEVALALLEGSSLFVHLDPRREGVMVPKGFTRQPQLVLQIGLNMMVRIPDLDVDDEGITCTLSFNRSPFWCRMPWTAVFALVSEDGRGGMIWPEDVPPELAVQVQKATDEAAKAPPKRAKPKLAAVGSEPKPAAAKPAARGKRRDVGAPPARPKLASVPLAPSEEAAPEKKIRRIPRPVPEAVPALRAADEPPPGADTSGPPGGSKKPRRELPPYLRVVK